ncbi:YkyA family protein [Bacillus sp. NPDC077027]|uniref:YkyA family protein n=1 Tax=Bacillus sp. NPDC077027 TaxID=3390548 RepID=UPI003D03FA3B
MRFTKRSVKTALIAAGICSFLLAGCGSQNPLNEMQDAMEKVTEKEKPFQTEQASLMDYEKKEQQLYKDMINTTKDKTKTVTNLSNQALALSKQRKKHLRTEKESMDQSKKEFHIVKESAERIADADMKEKAKETVMSMEKRYQSYDKLYREYEKALELDQKLYKSFKKKDLGYQELKTKLKTVNHTYSKVRKESKKFNDYTDQLNQKKQSLYRVAGYEIEKS